MLGHLVSTIRGIRLATDDRGVVMVWVALTLAVIMAFVAVVLDFGSLAINYRGGQNAADTAAFAAAEAVRTDSTGSITAATIAAVVNPIVARYGYTSSELTLSYLDSSNNAVSPSAASKVRAQIDHNVPTALSSGLISGASAQSLETTRSAATVGSGPSNAFYLIGNTGSKQLFVNGSSSSLNVTNGGIYVGSNASDAIQDQSGTIVATGAGSTISEYSTNGTTSPCSGCSPSVIPTTLLVTDPFAAIPTPSAGTSYSCASNACDVSSGTTTFNPGAYDHITVTGGTVTLNSGTYTIGANGFTIGGGTVHGSGVTIYLTCGGPVPAACLNTGQAGGILSLNSGTYVLTAPSSGQYQGLLIFYDRHNSSTMNLTSNSTSSLTGSVYEIYPQSYPQTSLTLTGNGNSTLGDSSFVISSIKITGNSTVTDNYGGDSQYRKAGSSTGTAW